MYSLEYLWRSDEFSLRMEGIGIKIVPEKIINKKISYIKGLYIKGLMSEYDNLIIEELDILQKLKSFDENFNYDEKIGKTLNQALDMIGNNFNKNTNIEPFLFEESNGYTYLDTIGLGNFSKVLLVQRDDKLYALKICEDKDCYRCETEMLKILKHDSIIKLIDSWMSATKCYMILEYLGNYKTLASCIKEKIFSKSQMGIIINRLCDTIKYIHSKKVEHRDIKPDNIMVNPITLEVKLIDFGFSCNEEFFENICCGTPRYKDPQLNMISNDDYDIDFYIATDLWSLGITIFKFIIGVTPCKLFYDKMNEENGTIWNEFLRLNPKFSTNTVKENTKNFDRIYRTYYSFTENQYNVNTILEEIGVNIKLENLLDPYWGSRNL